MNVGFCIVLIQHTSSREAGFQICGKCEFSQKNVKWLAHIYF
jgi:hypothetical protein